jgi:preprotein translocase subunit SecB
MTWKYYNQLKDKVMKPGVTDEMVDNSGKEGATQKTQVQVNILGQYIKNLSFQSPIVPQVFKELKEEPKIELNLDIQVKNITETQYEVTLLIEAEALKDKNMVFAVDLEYAGLFEMNNVVEEEQKKQILLIYCPNLIFPFARSVIANITRDAGFQPLMINPLDFAGLYMQQTQTRNQESLAQDGGIKTIH